MRSVITASAVFLLAISICITCYFVATRFSTELSENLEVIKRALKDEDFNTAQEYSEKSLKKIEKTHYVLEALANHAEISNMKNKLLKLNQQIKDKSTEQASITAIETAELIDKFYNSERITFENIF